MSLALLARSHSDIMDVGLHDLIPDLIGPESKWLNLTDLLLELCFALAVDLTECAADLAISCP